MIKATFDLIKIDLSQYLSSLSPPLEVEMNNIANWEATESTTPSLKDKIIMSLIRTEEEALLKNHLPITSKGSKIDIVHPPVHLNLFVLFAANYENYPYSLLAVSRIVEFFGSKKVFTQANTGFTGNAFGDYSDVYQDFKVVMNLFTPSFEELNNIWSVNGGKLLPAVFYKVQLVRIESKKKVGEGSLITSVSGNVKGMQ